ncbi:MAG: 4-alpha-glucanotransferase [Pseudomonadota bacterium]
MSAGIEDHLAHIDPNKLELLLQQFGIAHEFIQFSGVVAHIPMANRLHILDTMGISIESTEQVDSLLAIRELASAARMVPAVVNTGPGYIELEIIIAADDVETDSHWRLDSETGEFHESKFIAKDLRVVHSFNIAGRDYYKYAVPVAELLPGYYHFQLRVGEKSTASLLVVAPHKTWQPAPLEEGKKLWGMSVQLYSVSTDQNWGIGDFADLSQLVDLAAAQGADFILLNPLHALDLRYPANSSPYSPSDRRFLNPLYIAISLCPESAAPSVKDVLGTSEFQHGLATLRSCSLVDYEGVQAAKLQILGLMYKSFLAEQAAQNTERWQQFQSFIKPANRSLHVFARHQASLFVADDGVVAEPGFHLYMQWLADGQVAQCQARAKNAGMTIGLVRDLAVGSSVDGCEVNTNPELFCGMARIGAPPDNFNPDGQNWGLPPLLPEQLVNKGFAHFIELLRSNMQSCGALRIDHVMALMRLWWCPQDGTNSSGAYVHYPVDIMFAILRLESQRNHCVIIGEDLGVVPPEIRSYLEQGNIYSNCVFYFEKYDSWNYRKPEHYKPQALAMIANHDVPPLAAWWNGSDLQLRRRLGLILTDEKLAEERQWRHAEKQQMLQWLAEIGLLPESWHDRSDERPLNAALLAALVSGCARSASKLLSLQLDDLAGMDMPVNIPGTSSEYTNWQRKIPMLLGQVFANPAAIEMLQALHRERHA